jgi:hypothetical protein
VAVHLRNRGCGRRPRIAGPVAAALLGAALVLLTAQPAAAHSRAQLASSFESRVVEAPPIEGVRWHVYAGGEMIEIDHRGDRDLVVLGYSGEPFLRVGPDGVFENLNAPATYLNRDRLGDVAVPPRADAAAVPEWSRVSDGPRFAWHDHRVHWMSEDLPTAVRAAPRDEHLVDEWSLPVRHDGRVHHLEGELRWVPGPTAWPWLLVALLLTAPVLAGLALGRRQGAPVLRPAAATIGAVAVINSIHFADELWAWPAPTLDVLFGILHTVLFLSVGVLGAVLAWRGRLGPVFSLGIASGAVLFHQGLLQLPTLTASQLPTVWPPGLLRLAVALSLAQALWVAVVLVLRARATTAPRPPTEAIAVAPGDAAGAVSDHRERVGQLEPISRRTR